ncbi:3'-5' DNA helicase involved in error-free bypass of DNA lesions, putative [Yarrowia lipolytica]|nr:3'-5' DNA helicase involved in error-free bypass of DNA lesions, putative [Yarrowia lipolytica]
MLLDDLSDSEFDALPKNKAPALLDDSDLDDLDDLDDFDFSTVVKEPAKPVTKEQTAVHKPSTAQQQPTPARQQPLGQQPPRQQPSGPQRTQLPRYNADPAESTNTPDIDLNLTYPRPMDTACHHETTGLTGSFLYPSNLPFRTYQHTIIQSCLIENTLCSLPTGLGKTFIASVVMLNFYRWFKDAKIIFMAPTKPLVSQQIDACLRITGIPRHDCSVLMGGVKQADRAHEWAYKRVFFATPQVVELDLDGEILDPKTVSLLVVDEAHHTSGKYSYGIVVKKLLDAHQSFRVLGLTATPASKVEGVQSVVQHLLISHLEVKGEQDPDVQQYMHNREEVKINVDLGSDINELLALTGQVLKPTLSMMASKGVLHNTDIAKISLFGVKKEIERYMFRTKYLGPAAQYKYRGIGAVVASIAHATQLLQHQGITQFYDTLKRRHDEEMARKQPTKSYEQVGDIGSILDATKTIMKKEGYLAHPKLNYLGSELNEFFSKAPEGANTGTCIIFARFRSTVNVIMEYLTKFPQVKPHEFIGQAPSREEGGGRGMTQKKQQEVISKFRKGVYNTLVATSIAEEGLDIGQVDLIICYDSNASPITSLQRMGRTGRSRDGRVVLLMTDKEMENNIKSRDNYSYIQRLMEDGSRVKLYPPNRVIPGAATDPPPPHFMKQVILPGENQEILDKTDKDHLELADVVAKGDKELRLRKDKNGHFIVPQKRKKKVLKMPENATLGFMTAKEMAMRSSQSSNGQSSQDIPNSPTPPTKRTKVDVDELEADLDEALGNRSHDSLAEDIEEELEQEEVPQHLHDLVELDDEREQDMSLEEFIGDDDFDKELEDVLNSSKSGGGQSISEGTQGATNEVQTTTGLVQTQAVPVEQRQSQPSSGIPLAPVKMTPAPQLAESIDSSSFDDEFFDRLDEALAKPGDK